MTVIDTGILIAAGNLVGALLWLLSSMNTKINAILGNHIPHLEDRINRLEECVMEIKKKVC